MKHVGHVIHTASTYIVTRYFRTMSLAASVFSTSHDPTNGKPNAAVSQRTPRGEPGSESLAAEREWRKASKYTTSFTPEDRAHIGKYASENGNAAAVKKFKPYPYTSLGCGLPARTQTHLLDSQCSPKCPVRNY